MSCQYSPYHADELEALRSRPTDPEYPDPSHRLVMKPEVWAQMVSEGCIEIQEGPHEVLDHSNRRNAAAIGEGLILPTTTKDNPVDITTQLLWRQEGWLLDSLGRRLHPRASQLLTTEGVGMYTGPGCFWREGPQDTADLALRRERSGRIEYAVIGKKRNGLTRYLFPGGHQNPEESLTDTAFREAQEEAGIMRESLGELVLARVQLPPGGFGIDTLHAWGRRTIVFARSMHHPGLDGVELSVCDPEEVSNVVWMSVEQIISHPHFSAGHRMAMLKNEAGIVDGTSE